MMKYLTNRLRRSSFLEYSLLSLHVHVQLKKRGKPKVAGIYQKIIFQEPVEFADESLVYDCEVIFADSKQVVLRCMETLALSDLPGFS